MKKRNGKGKRRKKKNRRVIVIFNSDYIIGFLLINPSKQDLI
jgi:hypothetical protein